MLALAAGIWSAATATTVHGLRERGVVTTGSVVETTLGRHGDAARIRYTVGSKSYVSRAGGFSRAPALGTPVDVIYDPQRPGHARKADSSLDYFFPVTTGTVAVVAFLLAAAVLFGRRPFGLGDLG